MNPPKPDLEKTAVVLVGHGAPATDCPARLIGELMALQWRDGEAGQGHGSGVQDPQAIKQRIVQLDAQIRDWPRGKGNDPYKTGLERVASVVKALLPSKLFAVGYNEFCRPSVSEAVEQMIRQGATRVLVVPSMLTPGGVHSEEDIPRSLRAVQEAHPGIGVEYVWPFDIREVARLLAGHVEKVLTGSIATPP